MASNDFKGYALDGAPAAPNLDAAVVCGDVLLVRILVTDVCEPFVDLHAGHAAQNL